MHAHHVVSLLAALTLASASPARADDGAADRRGFTPNWVGHDARLETIPIALSLLPLTAELIPQSHRGGAPDAAHARNRGVSTFSDYFVTIGTTFLVASATGVESLRDRSFRTEQLRASMVVAEATVLAMTLTDLPKRLVGRCRPYDWDAEHKVCDASRETDKDWPFVSFWSGHTVTVSAASGAALCLGLRDRSLGWPLALGLVGEVAAVATGALRVASGAHSWSDVGTGFLVGNGVGAAMCAVHPDTPSATPVTVAPAPGGLAVTGSF